MKSDALRGHLDAMVLATVESEPLHGYAIAEALNRRSDGILETATGTLYPALRRLEKAGWLDSEWSEVNGRRRRTYRLTSAGRRALAAEKDSWAELSRVVGGILGTT